jgi:hypothetical protein
LSIIEESAAVVNVVAVWNIHTAVVTFKASKVTYDTRPMENVPGTEQYTPEVRVSPDKSPLVNTCLQVEVDAALYPTATSIAHAPAAVVASCAVPDATV